MKYFIYCRKSSEEEDRQALSIQSQLHELREYAVKKNLQIVKEYIETKSAKKPGREVFNQMLCDIEAGEVDGILAWQPDRLSRNSVDGGKIIYLIDQEIIKDLQFPSYHFESTPHGKLNLTMAFGFSKMFVDRLSEDTKRGIREKVRRGEFPGLASTGYVNNLRTHKIEADPETFDLVKELFEQYAEGSIEVVDIREKLYQAGAKTKHGNPLSYSTIKRMLMNPFFYGVFRLKGELHQGTHPAMISKEVFDKIQKRLAVKTREVDWSEERKDQKGFLFQEIGKCGECGYSIINDYHLKNGNEFRYYKCSKKSKTCNCKQKAINQKNLVPQIERLSSEIAIDDQRFEWCMNVIESWRDEEEGSIHEQIGQLDQELEINRGKLERLLDLQLEGAIDLGHYKCKKNELVNEMSVIEDKISSIKSSGSIWFGMLKNALETSNRVHHQIIEKNYREMYQILKMTGSNRVLINQELQMSFFRPFCFFRDVILGIAKHTSPETTQLRKTLEIQTGSGAEKKETGEAGLLLFPPLTLISAQTGIQPRQAKSAEAASSLECALSVKWLPR